MGCRSWFLSPLSGFSDCALQDFKTPEIVRSDTASIFSVEHPPWRLHCRDLKTAAGRQGDGIIPETAFPVAKRGTRFVVAVFGFIGGFMPS